MRKMGRGLGRASRPPQNPTPLRRAVRGRAYKVDLKSSRLGVPDGLPVITFVVALVLIKFEIVAADASPKVALYSAPTPVTCGVAMEVPLIVFVPPLSQADVMLTPGA